MTEDAHFLEEVRANPQDRFTRLVYADWLDEIGDPYGEFIRTEMQLVDLDSRSAQRPQLIEYRESLLAEHGQGWFDQLAELGVKNAKRRAFSGGFVEEAMIDLDDYLKHHELLYERAPALQRLHLKKIDHSEDDGHPAPVASRLDLLAEIGLPPQIDTLIMNFNPLSREDCAALHEFGHKSHLESLHLSFCDLAPGFVEVLFESDWPFLRRINCDMNAELGEEGVRVLLDSKLRLERLEMLSLKGCGLTGNGADLLLDFTGWENLTRLDLASNRLGETFANTVASPNRHAFNSLVELNLRSTGLSRQQANAFLKFPETLPLQFLSPLPEEKKNAGRFRECP